MTTLNLHALAATIVRESPHSDPGILAKDLVRQIEPSDYAAALEQMARAYVRRVIADERHRSNGGAPGSGSAKVTAAREAWRRLLNCREYVPSSDSWLFLRDASRDQVLEMAAHRSRKAHENAAAAKRYQVLAEEMREANVLHVSDLADDVLARALAPQERVA